MYRHVSGSADRHVHKLAHIDVWQTHVHTDMWMDMRAAMCSDDIYR